MTIRYIKGSIEIDIQETKIALISIPFEELDMILKICNIVIHGVNTEHRENKIQIRGEKKTI